MSGTPENNNTTYVKKMCPLEEQDICITCGFCCDGTLFDNAVLKSGEKGNLPEKIEQNYFKKEENEFFRLPCLYFDKKCTIYNQKKAIVCSSYRCQLLKDYSEKRITQNDALEIVKRARVVRRELFDLYSFLSENSRDVYFKELLFELKKIGLEVPEGEKLTREFDVLVARSIIFEALLIKHFRSVKEFNSVMEPSNENINI